MVVMMMMDGDQVAWLEKGEHPAATKSLASETSSLRPMAPSGRIRDQLMIFGTEELREERYTSLIINNPVINI
jgi:hypothetical protein